VLTIQLTDADLMPASAAEALVGTFLHHQHFDRMVTATTKVLRPDGTTLLVYVADVLPRPRCLEAYDVLARVRATTTARATAAGLPMTARRRRDGSLSRTKQHAPVRSAVLGVLDRQQRAPVCRLTAWTRENLEEFDRLLPFVTAMDHVYREHAPERWAAQHAFVSGLADAFRLPGSAFTTLTANHTWRTAAHRDAGDLPEGFGVMAVLAGGADYEGFELVFPRCRTAVDVRTGGVLLADVHELHGNAPVRQAAGRFVRLSLVAYARAGLARCAASVSEELGRHQVNTISPLTK
jgi:hypothetical protein